MTESYSQYKARVAEEQSGMDKDDVMDSLQAEYKLDLDNLPKQKHNWVQRGIKVNCEGAGHPFHGHFLTRR